jgi:Fe2+ or Zn2+ uptake regulation protein
MDEAERAILDKYGFELEYHRYKIFGLCRDCRKKTGRE